MQYFRGNIIEFGLREFTDVHVQVAISGVMAFLDIELSKVRVFECEEMLSIPFRHGFQASLRARVSPSVIVGSFNLSHCSRISYCHNT